MLVSVLIVGFDVQVADVDLRRGLAPRLGDGLDRTLVRATGSIAPRSASGTSMIVAFSRSKNRIFPSSVS